VDAATKAGLLALVDDATAVGWSLRGACRELELAETRLYRWRERREAGDLDDKVPGGHPMHGLLDDEIAEIVALYHEWGEIDRSHRKLAHRGSYTERVWVAPSSVRRVLAAQGLRLHPPPRPGSSVRKPFPEWVEYRPKQLWIYDTTHFTRAKAAVTVVEDLVSRKWIADILSSEETSTQVEIVSTWPTSRTGSRPARTARLRRPPRAPPRAPWCRPPARLGGRRPGAGLARSRRADQTLRPAPRPCKAVGPPWLGRLPGRLGQDPVAGCDGYSGGASGFDDVEDSLFGLQGPPGAVADGAVAEAGSVGAGEP